MKSAGKARNNGLYRHIRTSKEIIRNLLNDFDKRLTIQPLLHLTIYIFWWTITEYRRFLAVFMKSEIQSLQTLLLLLTKQLSS